MKNNKGKIITFFILVLLAFMCVGGYIYAKRNFVFYNSNPISQILFHVIVQIDGTNPTFIRGIIVHIFLIPLVATILLTLAIFSNNKLFSKINKNKFFDFIRKFSILFAIVMLLISFLNLANYLDLKGYIDNLNDVSTLYEEEYVDPSNVNYTFPETKRNLIYIILESMETSEYSRQEGGAFDDCYIPELYELANENITFNNNKGFYVVPGTSWTVASMIAQSSGIPLDIPLGENDFVTSNKFLPGAYTLGDLLSSNGYTNELLLGSDAVFAGRSYYYQMHGNYIIHDFNWAMDTEKITEEDHVWWGYEDYHLFEFAKEDLQELSSNSEPFNLTLLTVDTHHEDGWVCKYCEDQYDEQLANVYACSSRQVSEFVEWCKTQDFFENTTIIIAGDHASMDPTFNELIGSDYERHVYFTIINPADGLTETENREFCALDLYPTTVASLGITFDENRLGLGTNLFSNEQTLIEKYGKDEFFHQLSKGSKYYTNHILYGLD